MEVKLHDTAKADYLRWRHTLSADHAERKRLVRRY